MGVKNMMPVFAGLLGGGIGCLCGSLLLRSIIAWGTAEYRRKGRDVTEAELNCAKRVGVGLILGESLLVGAVAGVMALSNGAVATLITAVAIGGIFAVIVFAAVMVVEEE
jgi:hypothetical protein